MAKVVTGSNGSFKSSDLKSWMVGGVKDVDSKHIEVDTGSYVDGTFYGDLNVGKYSDITGTITGFDAAINSPLITFTGLHADASRVLDLIEDGRITPLLKYLLRGNDEIDATVSGANGYMGENVINGYGGNDTLRAGHYGDSLYGGNGDDELFGSAKREHLDGGKGSDRLIGSLGADIFVFVTGNERDTIMDFDADGKAHDIIDLSNVAKISDFDDLKQHHLFDHGSDVWIRSGSGDLLVIKDVNARDLVVEDFLF